MPASVLIVDDEPSLRDALRDVLELAGCAVREAGGRDEALTALKDWPAQVVIGSGADLIKAIRAEGHRVRIVAMAQCAGVDCLSCTGADACLAMPFSANDLITALAG